MVWAHRVIYSPAHRIPTSVVPPTFFFFQAVSLALIKMNGRWAMQVSMQSSAAFGVCSEQKCNSHMLIFKNIHTYIYNLLKLWKASMVGRCCILGGMMRKYPQTQKANLLMQWDPRFQDSSKIKIKILIVESLENWTAEWRSSAQGQKS